MRAAFTATEAVLDRRCPELKIAFWTAVAPFDRRDDSPGLRTEAASRSSLDVRPPGSP
jgi:hypothetical protein